MPLNKNPFSKVDLCSDDLSSDDYDSDYDDINDGKRYNSVLSNMLRKMMKANSPDDPINNEQLGQIIAVISELEAKLDASQSEKESQLQKIVKLQNMVEDLKMDKADLQTKLSAATSTATEKPSSPVPKRKKPSSTRNEPAPPKPDVGPEKDPSTKNGETAMDISTPSTSSCTMDFSSTIPTKNRFSVLAEDGAEKGPSSSKSVDIGTKKTKMPPITLSNFGNWKELREFVSKTATSGFSVKTVGDKLKLQLHTPNDYRAIARYLKEQKIDHIIFNLEKSQPYRVLLRHVHASIPLDDVKTELEKQDLEVSRIIRLSRPAGSRSPPLILVELPRVDSSKNIYNITSILDISIEVESYRKLPSITQCWNCQQFHHGSSACFMPPRCVRCSGEHRSANCPASKQDAVVCINCSGNHPANFRGCPAFPKLTVSQEKKKLMIQADIRQKRPSYAAVAALPARPRDQPKDTPALIPEEKNSPILHFLQTLTTTICDQHAMLLTALKDLASQLK